MEIVRPTQELIDSIVEKIIRVSNLERGEDMRSPYDTTASGEELMAVSRSVYYLHGIPDEKFKINTDKKFIHVYATRFTDLIQDRNIGDLVKVPHPYTFEPIDVVLTEDMVKERSYFIFRFSLSNCKELSHQ